MSVSGILSATGEHVKDVLKIHKVENVCKLNLYVGSSFSKNSRKRESTMLNYS